MYSEAEIQPITPKPPTYDFNVGSEKKRIEKLRYIHRNPVRRGLVQNPEDWEWSSYRHYRTGEVGVVEIELQWTARALERLGWWPHPGSPTRPGLVRWGGSGDQENYPTLAPRTALGWGTPIVDLINSAGPPARPSGTPLF